VFREGAGASGKLSSSPAPPPGIRRLEEDPDMLDGIELLPHSCKTEEIIDALSADASTGTRFAFRYLNNNSFLSFRRFNKSVGLSVCNIMADIASPLVSGIINLEVTV
jgi:hypothetical protein